MTSHNLRVALFASCSGLAAFTAAGCTDETTTIACGAGTELDATGERCVAIAQPPRLTCGLGTHEADGQCLPNGEAAYELRVFDPEITADGLTRIPVLALGRNSDGSPSTEPVVLGVSRLGSGVFPHPSITLAPLGTVSYFRPCSSTQPNCTGPTTFTLTRVAAPETPVAAIDVNIVERPGGSSPASCMTGGNVLYLEGEDGVPDGQIAVRVARWGVNGRGDRLKVRVEPIDPTQGQFWRLEFSSEQLAAPLVPGVYPMAQRAANAGPGRPGMDVGGQGFGCGQLSGRFEVHDFQATDDVIDHATITFVQQCEGQARTVRGCLHIDRSVASP